DFAVSETITLGLQTPTKTNGGATEAQTAGVLPSTTLGVRIQSATARLVFTCAFHTRNTPAPRIATAQKARRNVSPSSSSEGRSIIQNEGSVKNTVTMTEIARGKTRIPNRKLEKLKTDFWYV